MTLFEQLDASIKQREEQLTRDVKRRDRELFGIDETTKRKTSTAEASSYFWSKHKSK